MSERLRKLWQQIPRAWQDRLRALPGMGAVLTAAEHVLVPPPEDAPVTVGDYFLWVPPGHYYSPLPDLAAVRARHAEIFPSPPPTELPGIDLNAAGQLALLREFAQYHAEQPFPDQPDPATRYHYENGFFSFADGYALYCMLRHLRPRRYLEIGSGFSSVLALDVSEQFLDDGLRITLIEPHPERLRELLRPGDEAKLDLRPIELQQVPESLFSELLPGDILFIDSTHVAKIGSDVNRILFAILPKLARGVYVHFHDIFHPFEYPAEWVYAGRAWNENYLLRAFLTYNQEFAIAYFNHYLATLHSGELAAHTPIALRNAGGSIWLRRK